VYLCFSVLCFYTCSTVKKLLFASLTVAYPIHLSPSYHNPIRLAYDKTPQPMHVTTATTLLTLTPIFANSLTSRTFSIYAPTHFAPSKNNKKRVNTRKKYKKSANLLIHHLTLL
jgi:hypothetical protein